MPRYDCVMDGAPSICGRTRTKNNSRCFDTAEVRFAQDDSICGGTGTKNNRRDSFEYAQGRLSTPFAWVAQADNSLCLGVTVTRFSSQIALRDCMKLVPECSVEQRLARV
jgi:hypothetical protein